MFRIVDYSRGVVSRVRPTMQLNKHRFEGQHGSKIELRSCFCGLRFEAGGNFENDSCDDRGGRDYRSKLR